MQESVIQWPLGLDGKELVGAGNTATVARLDAVIKFFPHETLHMLEREKLVYERIGRHSSIVRYFGVFENAIILQFASQTSIRQYFARQTNNVPLFTKLRWVEQLMDAICFIHARGVLHGDLSCNNVFLDGDLNIKLGDFAGSTIDGLPVLVCYETSHELPGEDISTRTELFALGSTIYEIMTESKPYSDLPDHEIAMAFSNGVFPDLGSIPVFKEVIQKCWSQGYVTVEAVLEEAKSEIMARKSRKAVPLDKVLLRSSFWVSSFVTAISVILMVGYVKRRGLLQ